jgi:catechol 2,3-dioxygenase-like lactoylglutathione lyase family enzyme
MLRDDKLIAFLATRDGARARVFYEKTLGFPVTADDDFALAIDAGGTMVRIQKVRELQPQPFTALGWQVVDISASVDDLVAAGVTFRRYPGLEQDARCIWTAPSGARIAWFQDPDGNTLSLTEL